MHSKFDMLVTDEPVPAHQEPVPAHQEPVQDKPIDEPVREPVQEPALEKPIDELAQPTASKPKRKSPEFEIINVLDGMNTAPEKIPYLVDGLLIEVGVSMLCGKPKTGKSTLAIQLAVAVAEGAAIFNKQALVGDVLFLSLEGPVQAFYEHTRKMGYTQTQGRIHLVHQKMPEDGAEGLAELEKAINKLLPSIRLVIIDPVAKLLRLNDSYAPEEVTIAIENLENIAKKYKLHLMFLVHAKKRQTDDPGDAAMGATSFRGGTDTNIFLMKQGVQRTITIEQRLGVGWEPTVLSGWNEETQTVNFR